MTTPIVSRLQVNLGWKAWFKPFFIHPSATVGAANNMEAVALVKKNKQKAQQEQLAAQELNVKTAKLLQDILLILEDNPNATPQKQEIEALQQQFRTSQRIIGLAKFAIARVWRQVHQIPDPALTAQLRAFFLSLQMAEYNLFIDVASEIKNTDNLEILEAMFVQDRSLEDLVSRVTNFAEVLRNDAGKDAIDGKMSAYQEAQGAERAERAANLGVIESNTIESSVKPYVNPSHIFQGAFLKTFGFDGYESTSTELVDARGKQYSYDTAHAGGSFPTVPFSLAFWTFLGFPTRLNGRAQSDFGVERTKANLGFREIVRNLVGGWDSLIDAKGKWTFQGKRLWNVILLPIKLVIFAVKLATFPLKLALNVLKLVTEFLPEVIMNYSGLLLGALSGALLRNHYEANSMPRKVVYGALAFLGVLILAPIHYAARLAALVGTALTSPEKSARMAWNYGRALNSRWGYVFGFLGAALSVMLTATLWAITFPLVFAKVLILFPALAPIVTSIAQWPIVASTLAYINGAATLVAGTVPAAFSLAASALSTAFGVTVSAMTLAVATTLAIIVAPVATIASRVMDGLSNLWTYWPTNTPLLMRSEEELSTVAGLSGRAISRAAKSALPSSRPSPIYRSLEEKGAPSSSVLSKVQSKQEAHDEVELAVQSAGQRAEVQLPYFAQTPKGPAPGIYCEPPRTTVNYASL